MYLTTYAQEIGVTARLFDFDYMPGLRWDSVKGVSPAIWAVLTLITSSAVNMLPVKASVFFQLLGCLLMHLCIQWYGELEYWFGYIKILGLVVITVVQVPINLQRHIGARCEHCQS